MQSIPWLPSLSGTLWPGVVASDRVLSVGQTELSIAHIDVYKLFVFDTSACTKKNPTHKM